MQQGARDSVNRCCSRQLSTKLVLCWDAADCLLTSSQLSTKLSTGFLTFSHSFSRLISFLFPSHLLSNTVIHSYTGLCTELSTGCNHCGLCGILCRKNPARVGSVYDSGERRLLPIGVYLGTVCQCALNMVYNTSVCLLY